MTHWPTWLLRLHDDTLTHWTAPSTWWHTDSLDCSIYMMTHWLIYIITHWLANLHNDTFTQSTWWHNWHIYMITLLTHHMMTEWPMWPANQNYVKLTHQYDDSHGFTLAMFLIFMFGKSETKIMHIGCVSWFTCTSWFGFYIFVEKRCHIKKTMRGLLTFDGSKVKTGLC